MNFEILADNSRLHDKKILCCALFDDSTLEELSLLPSSIALYAKLLIEREDFKFDKHKTMSVPLADGDVRYVVLGGLGKKEKITTDDYRRMAFSFVRFAADKGSETVAISMPNAGDPAVSRAIGEGAVLAGYRFEKYRSKAEDDNDKFVVPTTVGVRGGNEQAINEGRALANCQCYARDLANEPGNVINPATLESEARELADRMGLEIEVFESDDLKEKGMNALLAVGQGSATPPRLICLTYAPKEGATRTVAVVGKGITFDSGGLSLKPADSMVTMKGDKTGACVALAVIRAAAELKLPVKVHAIVGAAENMPSGSAYRPDDVIKAYNGKTIEVNNTDAEGRITLADALAFASELKPDCIIDIATLTGACAVALGETTAGLFTNDDGFGDKFLAVSSKSGERFWKMPMDDENLRKKLKSPIADLINSAGRYGGAITAAMFLEAFVGRDIPWIHLDIAAADYAKKPFSYYVEGATAFGMRAIASYLLDGEAAG